ncbi:MAG: DUF3592 domain-containing protein [Dyella sp.]|uniref:DUF3592 domain-containing protein n=1 Tax=Dyella sp. TaxID=1869338 RepID=UPI003F7D05CD
MPHRHGTTHHRNPRNGRMLQVWLCAGMAVALLVAGWLTAVTEHRRDTTLALAHGHVTAVFSRCGYYDGHRRTHCKWFPTVRFSTAKGQTITFISNVGMREPAFVEGQGVRVRYDPRAASVKESAFIVGYGLRYSTFLYCLALAASALACLLAPMAWHERRKT